MIGQSASTKNSLQKAICILLMDPWRQKKPSRNRQSVQMGGGRGWSAFPGGQGFVPDRSLGRARLKQKVIKTEVKHVGVLINAEHLLQRTKGEQMSLHFSMKCIKDIREKLQMTIIILNVSPYWDGLSYHHLTQWFFFLSLLDTVYFFRIISQLNWFNM